MSDLTLVEADPFDVRRARRASGLLGVFNVAGVLSAAEVHVAGVLGALTATTDETVLLAAALAAQAPRLGHVCVDLAAAPMLALAQALPEGTTADDVAALPWPPLEEWLAAVRASALVGHEGDPDDRSLRMAGTRLYLDRYWREEQAVAGDLASRAPVAPGALPSLAAAEGLERLFPSEPGAGATDRQRLAAAVVLHGRLTVLAGGPGTGKTTAVARILALLVEQAQASGVRLPRIALAAPTGKAAARLQEAIHGEALVDIDDAVRGHLLALDASTLHRLLGWQPGNRSRFRHDRLNRLPHDVVVVDEASMVSLSLMAKLVAAVRGDARLVLLGDPDQLASVEAGAVLGDIVGPAGDELPIRPATAAALSQLTGQPVPVAVPRVGAGGAPGDPGGDGVALGDCIVVLRHVHRFGGGIATLAEAIRQGDADAVVAALAAGGDQGDLTWIDTDAAEISPGRAVALDPVRRAVEAAAVDVVGAARHGDGRRALMALGRFRLLCAHRRGPYGVAAWTVHLESWLAAAIDGYRTADRWYAGRPLLVTENDHSLRLFNGDTGVVVLAADGSLRAAFERRGEVVEVSPSRLAAVETMHAMTVHKSQGSQLDAVAVVLPDPGSPILTRELIYTAVTRARSRLTVVATEASVRAAVERPLARASGLRELLWGDG